MENKIFTTDFERAFNSFENGYAVRIELKECDPSVYVPMIGGFTVINREIGNFHMKYSEWPIEKIRNHFENMALEMGISGGQFVIFDMLHI